MSRNGLGIDRQKKRSLNFVEPTSQDGGVKQGEIAAEITIWFRNSA